MQLQPPAASYNSGEAIVNAVTLSVNWSIKSREIAGTKQQGLLLQCLGSACWLPYTITLNCGDCFKPGLAIDGHVDIGAGAKIIRSVAIGNHAQIGANAVVLCDVPAYAVAMGIPAKVVVHAEIPSRLPKLHSDTAA